MSVRSVTGGGWYLLVGLIVATVIVIVNPKNVWVVFRPFVTWLHEGGHAATALALSGEVRSITIRKDTSGLTACALPGGRGLFRNVRSGMVAIMGTPSPMIVGCAIGVGVAYGYTHLVIGCVGAAVLLTFFRIRNLWGLLVVSLIAGSLVVASVGGPVAAGLLLGIMAGLGLFGGLRTVFEEHRSRDSREGGDGAAAAAALHLPVSWIESLWVIAWVVCATGLGVGVFYAA